MHGFWRRLWLVGFFGPACLLLAACGNQELYTGLDQRQATEMIGVLRAANIDAAKEPADNDRWAISVSPDNFSRAVEVLRANGLPREQFASLGDVFEKQGFVSSPVEEHARLIHGLSQELSHTVSEIDGVVQARVHLVIPERDPLSDAPRASSAAVFIKYQPGFDLRAQTGAIKSLVANSVEGLSYDRVSVAMFPSQAPPEPRSVAIAGIGLPTLRIGLIVLALIGIGYALFRRSSARRGLPQKVDRP
jgi:type III secretion protein J